MECPHCKKTFTHINGLKYHMSQNVCLKCNAKQCSHCRHQFTDKRRLQYHIDHNICGISDVIPIPKHKLTLKSSTSDMLENLTKDELINYYKDKTNYYKDKYESLSAHPQTVNNNNVMVFPKEFGKEDLKYIQEKFGDVLSPLIKSHTFHSIPCLFNEMHNNPQMPEYHNVYASSERSSYVMVSDGKTFKHQPKKTIIDQIIEDKRSILNEYVDTNGDQLGEKVLQKYERYQDQIDSDSDFRKNLELEIGGMLLDMRAVIANDEKPRLLLAKIDDGHFELE